MFILVMKRAFFIPFGLLFVLALLLSSLVRLQAARKCAAPDGDEIPWMRMAVSFPGADFLLKRQVEHDLYFRRVLPQPEDNRSPLYPALISWCRFFPEPFAAAKMFNFLVYLALASWMGLLLYRKTGPEAALAFAAFAGCSPLLIVHSVNVYPDLLFALGVLLVLVYAEAFPLSRRNGCLGGLLLGLLVLLKTTGLFLLPVVFYFYFRKRNEPGAPAGAGLFMVVFIALIVPWCARNHHYFGSFLHQFSSYNLWVDNGGDIFKGNIPRPSFSRYASQHGLFFILLERPAKGMAVLLRTFWEFDHGLSLFLLPLAVAGLAGAVRNRVARGALAASAVFLIGYLPFMAYLRYSIWVTRYIMVFYVMEYALAAMGVHFLFSSLRSGMARRACAVAAILLPLFSAARPFEYYISGRGASAAEEQAGLERGYVIEVSRRLPPEAVVLSSLLYRYCYLHDARVLVPLQFGDAGGLAGFLRDYRAEYALLDPGEPVMAMMEKSGGRITPELLRQSGPYGLYRIRLAEKEKGPP